MAAMVKTPAYGFLATTEADLTNTTVSSNEEWFYDIRLTNITGSAVTVRILISDGTNITPICYDMSLGPNQSVDVIRGLGLPAGWRIRGRAGTASAVNYVITPSYRSTL